MDTDRIHVSNYGCVQVAPIRGLNDFLLETDRFKLPDFSNLVKWNDRIIGNLLYYQTNYMITVIVIFALIAIYNPSSLMVGLFSLATGAAVLIYLRKNKPAVESFQKDHPVLTVLAAFLMGYLLVYLFDCVAAFLMATLFPILLMFIHASCRQRGIRNKMNDKLETLGIKKTPMGICLDFLGQELDKLE